VKPRLFFFESLSTGYSCSICSGTNTCHSRTHAYHYAYKNKPTTTHNINRVLLEIDEVPRTPQVTGTSHSVCGTTRERRNLQIKLGKPRCKVLELGVDSITVSTQATRLRTHSRVKPRLHHCQMCLFVSKSLVSEEENMLKLEKCSF
jgi:hypothetical protein